MRWAVPGEMPFLGAPLRIEAADGGTSQVGDHPIEKTDVDASIRPAVSEERR